MNILLLASHAVAEYDDVRMFHDLGYGIFAPGGYENPATSGEGIRPALPQVPYHADLAAACREQRERYGEPGPYIDWAKARLHPDVIDWADVIIVHHFPRPWVIEQWPSIAHKRVIWRTCGQSDSGLERDMARLRRWGLQVVRYSPAERRYFEEVGAFAGEDALIRFGKYPDDYGPWVGDHIAVGNVTQRMVERGDACGYRFWQAATTGLPVAPAGPGSEAIGGIGELAYPDMLDYLRHLRAYLYTGTRPASYTLGLIEAMLSGVPVVSIGMDAWGKDWGGEELFEGGLITGEPSYFDPVAAREDLERYLLLDGLARTTGERQRQRAIDLFGIDTIGPQWVDFLGQP